MRSAIAVSIALSAAVCLPAPGFAAAAPTEAPGSDRAPDAVKADAYFDYCLSRQALHRHDFGAAIEHMKNAAASDPNSSELALEVARLYLDLNDPEGAAEAARRALDLSPAWPPAQELLAAALLSQASRQGAAPEISGQAEKAYRELVTANPADAESWINLARLQLASGRMEEGIASLRRHLQIDPASEEGAALAARALVDVKRPAEAVDLLTRSLERAPRSVGIRFALAETQEAAGETRAALETLAPLRQGSPVAPRASLAMARLQQKLGNQAEAVKLFEEGAAGMEARPLDFSEPERAEAQLRWARGLIDAGRAPEAASLAARAGAARPADVRFVLVESEALLTQAKDAEAALLLSTRLAVVKEPERRTGLVSDVYLSAGARCERAGEIDCARKRLRQSIEALPANDEALNYLGYMLAERGEKLDEAIEMIQKALIAEPANGAYLDSLGWARFKRGDYAGAEESLRAAAAAMPEEAAVHEHLGDLYGAQGRRDEAMKAWTEAIDRGAANAETIRARMALPPAIRTWVKGRITAGGKKSRFEGALVAVAPDRLRVDISGPVGGTRAMLAVHNGRLRVLFPAQREYLEMDAAPEAWEALLGIGVDTATLIDLIRQAETGAPVLPVRAGNGLVRTLTLDRKGDHLVVAVPETPAGPFEQLDLQLREVEHPAPGSIDPAAFRLEIPEGWRKLDLRSGSDAAPVLLDPTP